MRTPALVTLLAAGLAAASPSPMALNSRACARLPSGPDPNVRNQIYRVALDMGVNAKVMLAMMACAITETWVNNLPCGDKDSLGVFQQRPSMNWGSPDQLMNVTYSTRAFLRPCIALDRGHPNVDAGTLAQMVQIAEAGNQYTKNLDLARHYIQLAAEAVGQPGPSQSSSDGGNDGPTSTPRPTSTSRPGSQQTQTSTESTTRPTDAPTPTTFKLPGPGVYTLYDQHGEPMTAVLVPSALVGRIDIKKDAAAAPTPTNRPKTNVGPCARAEYPRVGDSCMTFAERYQIEVDTLRELNEAIDSECLNLTVTEAWCVEAVNA